MNLVETIRAAIDRHSLIPDDANVVVGVSGGADSVALLRVFHQLNISCTVAHLNHGLRGAESDADEQFVRALADELKFPMAGKTVDVQHLAERSGDSIEMLARKARHDFFAKFKNAVIALAHHADDQVETFILKLARGAGTDGLSGMALFQQIDELRIIRPMLEIPRSEILAWLKENNFQWREDASNSDEKYLRNRVRHSILPLLENELNPNIRKTILRTMDVLREENAWMKKLETGNWKSEKELPLAEKRRGVRKWLFENGSDEVGFEAVEKILALMDSGKGSAVFELNDRQRVVIEYGIPRFEEGDSQLTEPSWTLTTELGTGWKKDHGNGTGMLPAEASVDFAMVGGSPIEVRCFQPGDRISPFGMEGSRKLQDIFTDQKIPRAKRDQLPVVVCRNEIIWLPGYRIARNWAVQNSTEKSIHLYIEQNPTS